MNSLFKRALDAKEQKDFVEEALPNSVLYRKLLKKALEKKKSDLVNKIISRENYEKENFSEYQADLIGQANVLEEIIKIL